jgi:hypothetical protein
MPDSPIVESALPAMKAACSKLSAGGENQLPSPCAIRPKPMSKNAIHVTKEAMRTAGAKLVEIPVLPRRSRFQTGSIANSIRRATRSAPLASPGTTTVSKTSRSASPTRPMPATISAISRIGTPHLRLESD